MKKILLSAVAASLFAFAGGDIEEVPSELSVSETDSWEHTVSIYGWLPSFNGTLKYTIPGDPGDPSDQDTEGESAVLDSLDAVFMGRYELRKEKWSVLVDGIYLKMSAEQSVTAKLPRNRSVTVGSSQEFKAVLVSGYVGYNLLEEGSGRLDAIVGVRHFALDLDVDLFLNNRNKNFSPSRSATDALVGVKGYVNLSENWYIPYLFDIGAGDSDLTYQAEASLGYRFDWGSILATYRYIHYETDGSKLINDFDMYGPKIGISFTF